MHSDLLTRVQRSANSHPDRPSAFARGLELVTNDKPPVTGDRTVDEAKDVRLAELEKKNADEQARGRRRRAKAKARRINEVMARLNEAIYLANRLHSLCQKPVAAVPNTREGNFALVGPDSKLVQPMASVLLHLAQTLHEAVVYFTAPIVPCDREAHGPVPTGADTSHQDET
jgi:hypothetical protein